MKRRYPHIPIGYSGHEAPDNLDIVRVAVAKGATILERHVGIATDTIKLNAYSMTPEQTELWVRAAITTHEIVGDSQAKYIPQEEVDSLLSLARGVFALKDIKKGEPIHRHDVFFAMPCIEGQTSSGEYQESMIATRDYSRNTPIFERRQSSMVHLVRGIVHDAKGMLAEAGIEIGDKYEIELSHHFGIEKFRETGAVLINLINREYCKKLVVVLPGQSHPNHRHKVKEETFHLLRGDLTMHLDGRVVYLKPGDQLLLERGDWHSFTSTCGAVVEEISTTYIKGDSEYSDEEIRRKDPMERKTVLEDW
jgi:N-acetylneuraminate synthase